MTSYDKLPFFFIILTVAPSAPENVRVTKTTKDSANLEWKQPSDNGGAKIRRYHIWLSIEGSDDWKRIETADSYKTSTVVPKLEFNTKYLLGVTAENDVGVSERRDITKAIYIEKPLGKFLVRPNTTYQLQWTAV